MKLTEQNTPSQFHPYLIELNRLYEMYLLVMDLKRNRASLSWWELLDAYIFVSWAYLCDVWFNLTTASKLFKDGPRELTLTARLKRYRKGADKEKIALAEFICDSLLDQADPDGEHC